MNVNSRWFRVIVAFALAPISPGLVATILAAPLILLDPRKLSEAAFIIKLSAMLGYPIAIILGMPIYIFFRSRGWNGISIYITAGSLLGLIVYLAYVPFYEYLSKGLSGAAGIFSNTAQVYIPLTMLCGAVAALSFWLVARPDRAPPRG